MRHTAFRVAYSSRSSARVAGGGKGSRSRSEVQLAWAFHWGLGYMSVLLHLVQRLQYQQMAPIALQQEDATFDVKSKAAAPAVPQLLSAKEDSVKAATLAAAQARFEASHPNSKKQHERAVRSLPGGNTRSLLHTSPFPLCMKSGKGPYVWDEDGHKSVAVGKTSH